MNNPSGWEELGKPLLIASTISIVLTGLVVWFSFAISRPYVEECHAKGGVLVRTHCIDRSVVLDG